MIDSGETEYILIAAVKSDGTATCKIAGDYDPYQVYGFVSARLHNLVTNHESTMRDDDENEKETANG